MFHFLSLLLYYYAIVLFVYLCICFICFILFYFVLFVLFVYLFYLFICLFACSLVLWLQLLFVQTILTYIFSSKHGGVFTLNMAGTYITVLAEHEPLRGYLSALDSGLNLRDAVVDFGFEETLGLESVQLGTEIHRHFITGHVSNNPDNMSVMVQQLVDALRSSASLSACKQYDRFVSNYESSLPQS